jgi:hypothetical protein
MSLRLYVAADLQVGFACADLKVRGYTTRIRKPLQIKAEKHKGRSIENKKGREP